MMCVLLPLFLADIMRYMNEKDPLQREIILRLYSHHLHMDTPYTHGDSLLPVTAQISLSLSINNSKQAKDETKGKQKLQPLQRIQKQSAAKSLKEDIQLLKWDIFCFLKRKLTQNCVKKNETGSSSGFNVEKIHFMVNGQKMRFNWAWKRFDTAEIARRELSKVERESSRSFWPEQYLMLKHVMGSKESIFVSWIVEDYVTLEEIAELLFRNDSMGHIRQRLETLKHLPSLGVAVDKNNIAYSFKSDRMVYLPFAEPHDSPTRTLDQLHAQLFLTTNTSHISLEAIGSLRLKRETYMNSLYFLDATPTHIYYSLNCTLSIVSIVPEQPPLQPLVPLSQYVMSVSETECIKVFKHDHLPKLQKEYFQEFVMTRDYSNLILSPHISMTTLNNRSWYYFRIKKYTPLSKVRFDRHYLDKITKEISKEVIGLHSKKIIHGDIKPHNIVFDQEENLFKLIDFEMAMRVNEGSDQKTHLSRAFGTEKYMSAEMLGLLKNQRQHVHLYSNDLVCLANTLKEIAVKHQISDDQLFLQLSKAKDTEDQIDRYNTLNQLYSACEFHTRNQKWPGVQINKT